MLLTLHTLRTFMDESGFCFPSQEAIAEAAAVSIRTVQNKLPEASRLHWLGMSARAKPGQQWKAYSYRACIPDSIIIENAKHERIVRAWAAQHGDVEAADLTGGLGKAPARRAGGSNRSETVPKPVDKPESTRTPCVDYPHATTEAPAPHDKKHPHQVRTNSDILSSQELSSEKVLLARTAASVFKGAEKQEAEQGRERQGHVIRAYVGAGLTAHQVFEKYAKRRGWSFQDVERITQEHAA